MRRLLAAVVLILVSAAPWRAQVQVEEIGTLQESFGAAEKAYASYQFPQAVEALNPLVDTLSRWEQAGRLQPQDEVLLERALELRGASSFNLGRLDAARQDFSRLIQLRPEYPFSRTRTPKIQRFFEDTRASLTGTLALTVDPPDSQVILDGRSLGGNPPAAVPVLKGLHLVRVEHPGYEAESREVNLDVGETVQLTVRLVPNARSITFFVQPEGTALTVDGQPAGKADKAASTRPEWAAFVRKNGGNPSSTFVIPVLYLPPGDHRVKLSKPCYESKTFVLPVTLDKVSNLPGLIKPITIERRTVEFRVDSRPAGAEVTVDGQAVGTTPVRLSNFCIGDHDLLVRKPGVGEFRTRLSVTAQDPFRVEAVLRPTLVWAGLTRDQDVTAAELRVAASSLEDALSSMTLFNAATARENNPMLPDTFFTPGVDEATIAGAVGELCPKYHAQGLLVGLLTKDPGRPLRVSLRLFLPDLPGFDEFSVTAASPAEAGNALAELDEQGRRSSPGSTFLLTDLPGYPGPAIVRGVADPAGPKPGEALVAVDGKPVATAAQASALLEKAAGVTLTLRDGAKDRTWFFDAADLPAAIPYAGQGSSYRKLWLLARQSLLSAESPAEAFAARLGLALSDLNLGRPDWALGTIDEAGAPGGGSLNGASAAYVKAVALVQMGRPEEARPLLLLAAGDADASLDGLGDILVQPLARDLIRQLPPPPPPPPQGDDKR